VFETIRRLIQRYGFFKREPTYGWYTGGPGVESASQWHDAGFYTEEKRRNERLAAIARERDALKLALDKAVKQKKKRSGIYRQIRALTNAEMAVEQGKPEPGK
jgi:hypothetical protein